MQSDFIRSFLFCALVMCMTRFCVAEDADNSKHWDHFRGPTRTGSSATAKPPVEWTAEKNVKWKLEVPGQGTSSPVIWGDKLFLTTAVNLEPGEGQAPQRLGRRQLFQKFDENGDGQFSNEERAKLMAYRKEQAAKSLTKHQFVVMCVDRNNGKVLWQDVANERKPTESHHKDHGFASASPITDGKHIYFHFGPNGLFCYDFDGKQVWKRTDLGEMETRGNFGAGSSIALDDDMIVMPWDHEGQSRIEAINASAGETVWKTDRDEPSCWATPRIVSVNGKKQVIHSGENYSRGYDLTNGEEIWRSSGLSSRPVATPIVRGNLGFFASSRHGAVLNAYHLDRSGDISSEPAWKITSRTPDCPSMLLSDNRLFYVASNSNVVSCANADDGSLLFDGQRMPGIRSIYSSLVGANGNVFVTGRGGKTVVIKDQAEFEVVQKNDIGERVDATLALVDDQIFIRGSKHLFCIEAE